MTAGDFVALVYLALVIIYLSHQWARSPAVRHVRRAPQRARPRPPTRLDRAA